MHLKALKVLLVAVVVGLSFQQSCVFPDNDDLENVISEVLQSGDSGALPSMNVLQFHPVCLAFGEQEGQYRLFSVVVQYSCTGHTSCPLDTAVEQIESQCNGGQWSNQVLGSPLNTREQSPEANFTTGTRRDCSFCLSPALVEAESIPATSDNITHCVGELFK